MFVPYHFAAVKSSLENIANMCFLKNNVLYVVFFQLIFLNYKSKFILFLYLLPISCVLGLFFNYLFQRPPSLFSSLQSSAKAVFCLRFYIFLWFEFR